MSCGPIVVSGDRSCSENVDGPGTGELDTGLSSSSHLFRVLAWIFVGGSIIARLVRYLLCPPLWGDESLQAAAFLDHGYRDLLGALPNDQIAPFGFLWIELTSVKLLGFHEWSLRLFPLLAGIAGVLLFHHVARRLLSGASCLLAVATFSSAYVLVRYSCEVKPYSSDAFVSIALVALLVEWRRAQADTRWLWGLVAATPIALCLSFPAVFVAGAISLALLIPVWRLRDRRTWTAYVCLNLTIAATFLSLQLLVLSRQYHCSTSVMLPFWTDGFMPISEPWRIPWWLVEMHTGDMFGYPYGGPHFQSLLTTIGCGAGLWWAWKRRQIDLLCGFAGMLALALIAAALKRYPYGIHGRVVLYAAGPICLLFGSGAGLLLAKVRAAAWRKSGLAVFLAVAACVLLIPIVRDLIRPYRSIQELQHREFARRLWTSEPMTICVQTEWRGSLYRNNRDAAYLCNWGRFHQTGACEPAINTPIRCVVFHSEEATLDQAEFDLWMRHMLARFDLTGHEQHRILISGDGGAGIYDIFDFLPRY